MYALTVKLVQVLLNELGRHFLVIYVAELRVMTSVVFHFDCVTKRAQRCGLRIHIASAVKPSYDSRWTHFIARRLVVQYQNVAKRTGLVAQNRS